MSVVYIPNNKHYELGEKYLSLWLFRSNISKEMRSLLNEYFSPDEKVKLVLDPDARLLYGISERASVCLKLKENKRPQHYGHHRLKDIMKDVSTWEARTKEAILEFKSTDVIEIIHFPDYQLVRFTTQDTVKYVDGIIMNYDSNTH